MARLMREQLLALSAVHEDRRGAASLALARVRRASHAPALSMHMSVLTAGGLVVSVL